LCFLFLYKVIGKAYGIYSLKCTLPFRVAMLRCTGGWGMIFKTNLTEDEVGGHEARMGEGRGVYRVLVRRPEGKRPLGRPTRKWENNIKMDLRDTGIDVANWIQLAHDRVQWWAFVNTVMNLRVP
jgi:hypothetical protein